MVALPAVLVLKNWRVLALVMVALPPVAVSKKVMLTKPPLLLVMLALPAVLAAAKVRAPSFMMVAFPAVLDWPKNRMEKLLLWMEELPAVLVSRNVRLRRFWMAAWSAVLASWKTTVPVLSMTALKAVLELKKLKSP
jgi:hypothetical protein